MRKLVNVPYVSELIKVILTDVNKQRILKFTLTFDGILNFSSCELLFLR